MIIQNVTQSMFIDAFKSWDTYKDNFTYEGLCALYDYLEQLSDDIGENIELDVVAICCDYTEYKSLKDCASDRGDSIYLGGKRYLKFLQDRTTVIEFNGGIIIGNF